MMAASAALVMVFAAVAFLLIFSVWLCLPLPVCVSSQYVYFSSVTATRQGRQ